MRAHSRRTDPVTSSEAAASVKDLTGTQSAILDILRRRGDLTRDTLIAAWRMDRPDDHTTDQSIRSRLSELMVDGLVVPAGEARNVRGRRVQVVGLPPEKSTLF